MSFIPGRLDSNEIRERIKNSVSGKYQPTDEEITAILQRFWIQDAYNSLVSYPEYLDYLITFLLEKHTADFTRFEFISFMVEKIIDDKTLLQKIMELASVMELVQANEIEPEKLAEIVSRLEIEHPEDTIQSLKEKSILEDKTVDGKILTGFKHHSLQEYLATKLILSTKDPFETAKQLIVLEKDGLITIKPSWYNVVRFLLESKLAQDIIGWLIKLGQESPQIIEEAYSNTLSNINPGAVSAEVQAQIFNLIYDTYQQRAVWLPLWTRQPLARLCQPQHLEKFKDDIEPVDDETATFVHRGTVADLVGQLLEDNNLLMTDEAKEYWKSKLVDFANDSNENGVLQRHSLSALATYKDSDLISRVTQAFEHQDKLVREAFLQFCYETDPNHELTIKYLVEGIKKGIDIYGRHGIYEVDSKDGIKTLLKYFSSDETFIKRFLDRESIFNDKERKGDKVLIDHVKDQLDPEILQLLKDVVKTAFQANGIYHHERSYFLEQLVEIIHSQDKNYLFEAINDIEKSEKNRWHLLCNYEELFAQIIEPRQLKRFFSEAAKLDEDRTRVPELTVYKARGRRGKEGERLYKEAVGLKLIEPLKQQTQHIPDRNQELYQEFTKLLEPSEGKYFPAVFGYFNRNQKELEPHLTPENKQRLVKLVIEEGLKKIDPKQIKVKINWRSGQSNNSFTISNVASYYGDLLRTAKTLIPIKTLQQYRQNIINFIPFAFSEDQQTILELTEPVNDTELKWVNKIYSDQKNDIRYLIPSSYIYLVKHHIDDGTRLKSTLPILKSIVTDEKHANHEREYALRQVEGLISTKDQQTKELLESIFTQYKDSAESEKLAIIANKILINVYKDGEAIKWRFQQLKDRLVSFKEPPLEIGHWVGPIEEELDSKWFARPLIELADDKYLSDFTKLLEFSFQQIPLADENDYWAYIKYLWTVVIEYFENLKHQGSFEPIKQLELWLEKNAQGEGLNWLREQSRRLYHSYELHFGVVKDISKAISILEEIRNNE